MVFYENHSHNYLFQERKRSKEQVIIGKKLSLTSAKNKIKLKYINKVTLILLN